MFDDYGRPINVNGGREKQGPVNTPKIVKAIPKIEDQQDVTGGVLKFRVKVLSEGIGQTDMDVLCQIGLDGIHILDPATSRTLRIYSLENVTRWEVLDSYIFAFWAKTSVDIEAKHIRLKSNSYTTNNILDAVTAASIQVKQSVFKFLFASLCTCFSIHYLPARMHKKNCRQFVQHLKLIGNLLEQLKITELKRYPETREPLEHFENALRRSYILVKSCQERSYLYLLAMGWNIVYQF